MAELTKQDTRNAIIAIIAEKLSIESSTITDSSTLQDLGADSLDLVEIVMRVEEQLNVAIDDQQVEQLKNVSDVVNYVHELRLKK